jgi:hypothetical protein
MLHKYHIIYSVRHYPRLHVTAVGLGTYYLWILGHYCTCISEATLQQGSYIYLHDKLYL